SLMYTPSLHDALPILVDKYTRRDVGSSYLLSELNAAYLSVQFDYADEIYQNRMNTWNRYYQNLSNLMTDEFIELPFIPSDIKHKDRKSTRLNSSHVSI